MIFKNLTFDGISLKEYGVYISGEAVFDSPTREVEMITIPGRNGSFALDKGRFNNITVTYPAGIYATSETEFAEKVSTLRNLLASRKGYCRLTDEYNPDEFRLGVYKAGLELDPTHYNEAGRFELSFDCKPQRFLFSGEEVFTLGEWGQTETKSGSIVSFEGDETTAIKSLTAQIVPKQSGSGDPSPSNIRPISGWGSVIISSSPYGASYPNPITGKNLYKAPNGTVNTLVPCHITAGANFTVSCDGISRPGVRYYNKDKVLIDYWSSLASTASDGRKYRTITAVASKGDTEYIEIYGATDGVKDIMVELGTTLSPYEPYGTTYPISLGQTVYGGVLDVVSGKLTIDRFGYVFNGTETIWSGEQSGHTRYTVVNVFTEGPAYTRGQWCSHFTPNTAPIGANNYNNVITGYTPVKHLFIRADAYATADELKAYILQQYQNGTPVTYVSYLQTPTEIQLTPTEVKTLLGQNNIWADSGDVTVEIGQNPYILVNPTLFEACPLIEFNSSGEDGEINLGSRQIKVLSAILGRVNLGLDVSGSKTTTRTWQDVITVQNAGSFNAGDTLRFNGGKVIFTFNFTPINVEVVSQGTDLRASWQRGSNNLELSLNNLEFPAGTDTTYSFTSDIKVKASETPSIEGTETFTVTTSYNRGGVLTITWAGGSYSFGEYTYIQGASNYTGYGDSTKNSLEDVDIYVDLDIGEAYSIDSDDNVVSLNNFVNLGGELPTLEPGATEISTDDSISNVKVTPRWWKV